MMPKLGKPLKALVAGVAAASIAAVSTSALAAPPAGIDEIVESMMKQWEIPGTAVAVVSNGKVVFAKGYGIRELGRPDPVDQNTIFGIGSVTKSFTSTAAAMLADDGKIEWDKPIIDYLPSLHFSDPWITAHATVRDLGAHRLGIDSLPNYVVVGGADLDLTVRTARYITPGGPFRSFLYSNTGTAILGKVIETMSGKSWDAFVTDRILRPLDMKNSFSSEYGFIDRKNLAHCWLCVPPAGTPVGRQALNDPSINVAAPHGLVADPSKGPGALRWQVLPWRAERPVVPAGMLFSSVADMAHYMIFHLNEGEYQGKRLMSVTQMRELHSAHVLMPANDGHRAMSPASTLSGYGLGWMIGGYKGHRVVRHAGGRVGFGADLWMFPDDKLGIVVLQNLDHQSGLPLPNLIPLIANKYLGIKTSPDQLQALARPAAWKPVSARGPECEAGKAGGAPVVAANFVGAYRSDLMGEATVGQENGKLHIAFEPQSIADLIPAVGGTFTACFRGYQPYPLAVRFTLDPSGRPAGFVLAEGAVESRAVTYKRAQ